jgi:hypothetical protein
MRWTIFAMAALGFIAYTATMVLGAWLSPDRAAPRYPGPALRGTPAGTLEQRPRPVALVPTGDTRAIGGSAMLDRSVQN